MTKKKNHRTRIMVFRNHTLFFFKDDIATLISALLIAVSIPLLVIKKKKPLENQDD